MSQTKSPFKFLDSYQQDDVDVYFGRKNETRDLYKALQGVKHMLVFGPSGSGKTSLIECGLRNQFSEAAWFALSVRRGQNIVESVFARINEVLAEKLPLNAATQLPANLNFGFGQAVERLFAERYQPVYLMFDQFEELLLLGTNEEKEYFFKHLQELIEYKTPCRVLLVMREEFIGHLSEWEKDCPSIFQHRFRLEKMSRTNVQAVIQQILEADKYKPHFQTQQPETLATAILSKLPDTQREIELAHVQVFLDELWHRAAGQTAVGEKPILQSGLLREDDDLERILDAFLKKQLRELAPTHGDKLPLELLATLITERHTKLQASPADMEAALAKNGVTLTQPLIALLHELEQRRILRALKVGDQMQYEISHDVVARVVGGNLTEEMKLRERAGEVYQVYGERKGVFSREDLDYLRPFEVYLAIPSGLKQRMKDSEQMIFDEIERRRKKALWTALVAGVLILVAVGASRSANARMRQVNSLLEINHYFRLEKFPSGYVPSFMNNDSLCFYNWHIQNVYSEIGDLGHLRILNLGYNNLEDLPAAIGKLQNLQVLNLQGNLLNRLPSEIGNLKNLQSLDLSSNPIYSLPSEIGNLKNLLAIDLSSDSLREITAEIGKLHKLKSLKISNNTLRELPTEIFNLQNLELLSLGSNQLDSLTTEIGKLQNLKSLDLWGNNLRKLPSEIGNLQNLERLGLSINQLDSLPAELGKLRNLKLLWLGLNNLRKLPTEIFNIPNLEFLNLSSNELDSLPPEIAKLQNLKSLELQGNHLKYLPIKDLRKMPNLKELVLQDWLSSSGGYLNFFDESYIEALRRVMPWCEIKWEKEYKEYHPPPAHQPPWK